jgi:hypothetical protein
MVVVGVVSVYRSVIEVIAVVVVVIAVAVVESWLSPLIR